MKEDNIEIERKFLVGKPSWKRLTKLNTYEIFQFYTVITDDTCERYRLCNNKAFFAEKIGTGLTRKEIEYQVPIEVARRELEKCKTIPIKKIRTEVSFKGYKWEIDTFLDDNAGLIIAEIELVKEDEIIPIPSWVTLEVTGKPEYLNCNLAMNPYNKWIKNEQL